MRVRRTKPRSKATPEDANRREHPKERPATPNRIPLPPDPEKDLPPNEHIRKHPDEVYGDTEIPHRRTTEAKR
jgi:hypothetical protein